jgi:hypothetical protein
MSFPRCPYCRACFVPSRFHPDQLVCAAAACQRRRRSEYHRQKLHDDPSYREQCRDSQRSWREEHPDYMRTYRSRQAKVRAEEPGVHEVLAGLLRNKKAIELTQYPARVWLISSEALVKNTLALAHVIVVEGLVRTISADHSR